MNSIDVMMEEHELIKRMLKVVRKKCMDILNGKELNIDEFYEIVDFIKTYADAHHHGKEEKILFFEMEQRLGNLGTKLIRHGMLIEHDLGRLYVMELVKALDQVKLGQEESKLDIVGNAMAYTYLLERHIAKEDEVIYPFGKRELPSEVMKIVDECSEQFEEDARRKGVQEKYQALVERLEKQKIH